MTPRPYDYPRISPDGQRLVVNEYPLGTDVWLYDMETGVEEPVTLNPAPDHWPIWSPDGSQVVFSSERDGPGWNLYAKAVDGSGGVDRLTTSPLIQGPYDWSADGELLVLVEVDSETSADIATYRMGDASGTVEKLVHTAAWEWAPAVSPNGRWMAYESRETGEAAIYVQPFPEERGGRRLIGVGTEPGWGPDGKELFYRTGEAFIAVQVEADETFERGPARTLFADPYYDLAGRSWDISPDGERFLMIRSSQGASDNQQIIVVQNWLEELKRLVP